MRYGEFIFYDTRKMDRAEIIGFLRECKDVCYKWWADKLDCSESGARQKIDCSFDEILGHLTNKAHFVVIDRGAWGSFDNREHFEIGFRSMESPVDYFLFIEVDSYKMPSIIEKYGLEPHDFTTGE